jgi:hypothetical protein
MAPELTGQPGTSPSRRLTRLQLNETISRSGQVPQARKVTIGKVGRVFEDVSDLTELPQAVRLLEMLMRSDDVSKAASLACLRYAADIIEVVPTQFFQRLIDQIKVSQSMAPWNNKIISPPS